MPDPLKNEIDQTIDSVGLPINQPTDRTTDFGIDKQSAGNTTHPSSQSSERAGSQRIIGGYRLNELLGEGGMGRVFKGVDANGRAVAVKLLSPQWSTSPDALLRFKQEGVVASQINHPNCVFVHRVDEDRGTPFIAMELMTGLTLKDLVTKHGALPHKEAVRLILQCIDGLIEAHSQGMIHRDVKPANCYLDEQGNVKIGDFGLARSLVDDSELTRTGAFLGTPLFASPEQVLGQKIDERSDIYSLTVTLYYLLAGKAPFESPNAAQVIAKIASSDPPPFRDACVEVPKRLEAIVMKGLARDRNKRYETFQQLRADLLPIVAPEEEIGSIPRRVVAMLIDSTIVSFVAGFAMFFSIGPLTLKGLNPLYTNLLGSVVGFLYFCGLEWALMATIGKRLVRLKVVDIDTGGRQSIAKIAVRAASFVFVTNIVETICHLCVGGQLNTTEFDGATGPSFWLPLMVWLGYLAGIAILLSTWWKTNKQQLAHEWLSHTATRVATRSRAVIPVRLQQPEWTLPLVTASNADVAMPAKIGRFPVYGQLKTVDESIWYCARDVSIDREIWIQVVPSSAGELHDERKNCVRRSRMRVIESGRIQDSIWNAYLAPDGVPLSLCVESGQTLPWPISRNVFQQLIEEHQHVGMDCVGFEQWSLSRIWIDSNGRITFSEAAILPRAISEPPSFERLMTQIALCTLPAKHRIRKRIAGSKKNKSFTPLSVNELAPLSGLQLMERVAVQPIASETIKQELRKVDDSHDQVNGMMRFSHASVGFGLLFPVYCAAVITLCIGGVIISDRLRRDAKELATLADVVRHPDKFSEFLSDTTQEEIQEYSSPQKLAMIDEASARRREQLKKAYASLGTIEHFILDLMSTEYKSDEPLPPFDVNSTDDSSNKKVSVGRNNEVQFQFGSPKSDEERSKKLTMNGLIRTLNHSGSTKITDKDGGDVSPSFWIIGVPILIIIGWTGLLRGGVSQMFTGVCIMRRDGGRIGIIRTLWRTSLLLLPFFAIAYAIPYLENSDIKYLWWTTQLKRLFLSLPIAYLIAALIWPQVGPHDRLSYTAMVPR